MAPNTQVNHPVLWAPGARVLRRGQEHVLGAGVLPGVFEFLPLEN